MNWILIWSFLINILGKEPSLAKQKKRKKNWKKVDLHSDVEEQKFVEFLKKKKKRDVSELYTLVLLLMTLIFIEDECCSRKWQLLIPKEFVSDGFMYTVVTCRCDGTHTNCVLLGLYSMERSSRNFHQKGLWYWHVFLCLLADFFQILYDNRWLDLKSWYLIYWPWSSFIVKGFLRTELLQSFRQ